METTPELLQAVIDQNSTTELLQRAIQQISAGAMNEDKVRDIAHEAVITALDTRTVARDIVVKIGDHTNKVSGATHSIFETVLKAVSTGCHVLLTGPAGSGKSTIARQVAEALGRQFHTQGPASSEYKYLGFTNVMGELVETPLTRAYRDGGVFCAEEIDASSPSALVAGLNMVLANGQADFANKVINRHNDFVCIATANTYGNGASREYVGRTQLDGATLDRFVIMLLDYDENLERQTAGNDSWVEFVQRVRHAANLLELRVIVSPRASIQGAKLLAAGISKKDVAEFVLWRGLDAHTRTKIKDQVKESTVSPPTEPSISYNPDTE